MTKCPQCNRTYAEDFLFCLDDGTPLKPSASQQATLVTSSPEPPPATLVMPSPETQPPTLVMPPRETQQPTPGPATASANAGKTAQPGVPPAARSNTAGMAPPARRATAAPQFQQPLPPKTATTARRSIVPLLVAVVGVLLILFVFGAVGVWLLSRDQNQNTAATQTSTSSASAPAANPNPGSTVIPLGDLKANQPASPTTSNDAPVAEGTITPGTYQCEVTKQVGEGTKVSVALKIQVAINLDGTYSSRGYMTVPEANIHDQLGIEEKGNYSQSAGTLILTNRKERQFNFDTGRWKGWATPDDGSESREKVRNVTSSTFELFDDDEKIWYSFSRV